MPQRTLIDKLLDLGTILAMSGAVLLATIVGWERLTSSASPPDFPPERVTDWRQYGVGSHVIGPPDAPVTIVEFGDYQCPGCRQFAPLLESVVTVFPDKVRIVYRHWPLPQHTFAYRAARAVECSSDQGRFRDYHYLLYRNASWLSQPDRAFIDLARMAGVPDSTAFRVCVSRSENVPEIERDIAAAKDLGGIGTPTLLINDLLIRSLPDSAGFFNIIREALNEARGSEMT